MTDEQFVKEFNLIILKRKILHHFKSIVEVQSNERTLFYKGLDLLKFRYTDPVDYNFIDLGIKNKIEFKLKNDNTLCMMNIESSLNNCNNEALLNDLYTLVNCN
jgi:hypothetical protein